MVALKFITKSIFNSKPDSTENKNDLAVTTIKHAFGGNVLEKQKAVCIVRAGMKNDTTGTVYFAQEGDGKPVHVTGEIKGLTPGLHGFHVHKWGDTSNGCHSAGEHFNPFNKEHGGPGSAERHAGDLGNIEADKNGVAKIDIIDDVITLYGQFSIVGRTMVVHEKEDDLGTGRGGTMIESKKTGNAGERFGCGVIGWATAEGPASGHCASGHSASGHSASGH